MRIGLLVATRNAHKTRELAQIFGEDFALDDLRGQRAIAEIEENGATFLENARIKAVMVSRQMPGLVLADDSGLEVDSLGGAPGIFSARYAGVHVSDAANREKLLAELAGKSNREARFVCVLVLACEGKTIISATGEIHGKIVEAERGAAGFGYDPLFQPDGFEKTFAEVTVAEKNRISHRARAVAQIRRFLEGKLPNDA